MPCSAVKKDTVLYGEVQDSTVCRTVKNVRCLVEKVSNVAILVAFFGTFWNFMLLFGIFCHYLGIFGLLRCFVANLIGRNLRTFWVNFFWLKPCLCKKFVFCMSGSRRSSMELHHCRQNLLIYN